jgi:hypothetical protein
MGFELSFELTVQSTPRALKICSNSWATFIAFALLRGRVPRLPSRVYLGCQGQGSAASDAVPAVGVAAAFVLVHAALV